MVIKVASQWRHCMIFKLNETQQKVTRSLIEKYRFKKDKQTLNFNDKGLDRPADAHPHEQKGYVNGVNNQEIMILSKVFKEHLQNEKILMAQVNIAFKPFGIHTDYDREDINPGHAILVPYETVDSRTIIFNETSTVKDDGLTTLRQLPINKNHPTKEEYNKYFTHNRWQDVQLLSIKEIFQWQKGYAVKWDRSEYHTSDNFLQNELNDKIALVMFNERV